MQIWDINTFVCITKAIKHPFIILPTVTQKHTTTHISGQFRVSTWPWFMFLDCERTEEGEEERPGVLLACSPHFPSQERDSAARCWADLGAHCQDANLTFLASFYWLICERRFKKIYSSFISWELLSSGVLTHTHTPLPLCHFLTVITSAIISTNNTNNAWMLFVSEGGGKNTT